MTRKRTEVVEPITTLLDPSRSTGQDELAKAMRGLVDAILEVTGGSMGDLSMYPDLVRMILVLDALSLDVNSSGIAKFLTSPAFGAYGRDAVQWCRRIDAHASAEYLEAAIARLPSSRLPRDGRARKELLDSLADQALDGDPFRDLDESHRGAAFEILRGALKYVRNHPEELKSWLAQGPGRAPRTSRRSEPRRSPPPTGARDLPARRPSSKQVFERNGDDPIVARFLSDLEQITVPQWSIIAERYSANLKAIHRAEEESGIAIAITMGRVRAVGRTKAKWKTAKKRATDRSRAIWGKIKSELPELGPGPAKLQIQKAAAFALMGAMDALTGYHELTSREGGDQVVGTLLAPFVGFVTIPSPSGTTSR